ncbi:RNA polymerase II-associated, Paf1 [Quillaja saponaria]|uniref:RNA polymerase II-associated, Paf1 n=1 Tax=Quillaja saponaria TaxID=32244 RepID=A0AAD7PQF6_QUISA|nr:RNA polymerase II-associated, Paf1 [Quillaja saponaria]
MNWKTPQATAYYPSSQYSQYNQQAMQPAPPLPPGSSMPLPPPPSEPPPSSVPPQSQSNEERRQKERNRGPLKDLSTSGRREHGHSNHVVLPKQQKPAVLPLHLKKSNVPSGRAETEEETRFGRKREFEKQRQDEKHRQELTESQNSILQQTQMLSSGKGLGSLAGSRKGERRTTHLLAGERIENRLKKPTTFLCKVNFRNELLDPSAQPKLTTIKKEKDRFTIYTITSLEKMYEPQLYVEPDLGIPLDLLDLSIYNPPKERKPLAPQDEDLLQDDESVIPVKKEGIRKKEWPTDKGFSWLVKTQYMSPLSTESAKQGGRNILGNLNSRERQIKEIEASFEAAKKPPVHATNKVLYPVEVLPLLPDFDRYDDQFVVAAFDSAPTADSEIYKKMDQTVRDAHESRAIMKSYVATGSDPANPEKFLAYMAPSPGELSKDIYDEDEDTYSWVREYNRDFGVMMQMILQYYLVSMDESEARYVPLPTKLVLKKKRAEEVRSNDEVEQFPVPSRVTVSCGPSVAAVELKDSGVHTSSKGSSSNSKRFGMDDGLERRHRVVQHQDHYQSSGAEDDMSD